MFFILLLVTFTIAAAVSIGVVHFFKDSILKILIKIVSDELAHAWNKYIRFAAYVVGISGGIRIHQLERYLDTPPEGIEKKQLTTEVWTLEVYRTIIETLQSLAWMLFLVFIVALIAFVISRAFEQWKSKSTSRDDS